MKSPQYLSKFNNLTNKLKWFLASIKSENFAKHLISSGKPQRKFSDLNLLYHHLKKTDGTWAIGDLEKANPYY
jgi:hypothetical protein